MCGILGTINKDINDGILSIISHRGPDDSDIVLLKNGEDSIYLGHVRLSIQDLSLAGHQPMYSECENCIIIFNGEIYNHLELREKLDVKWKGHSDTETIVNYMARYGIESIKDFNGIFGFALYDIKNEKIYIVRDRYGVKPIYYYQDKNEMIFSSEIRPIKKLINTDISIDNLSVLLKYRYNPAPTTIYKNIHKLRAGHILEYDIKNHSHTISSYITPVNVNKNISFDDALKRYGVLFENAIKRQLLSDVEVGVLLSGGIDSALVAYFAQKYSKKPIKTFTVGFEGDDDSDETLDAKETSKILGTEHFEVKISHEEFENIFEKCIDIIEEPLGTTSIIPMYYLNKLVAEKGLKVVLTGQGADEPLGGYKRYYGEKLHEIVPSYFFQALKPFGSFFKNESIYRAINSLGEKDVLKRWDFIYSIFSNKEIKQLINTNEIETIKYIKYFYDLLNGENKKTTNAMMSNDIRMNLCDDLLLYTDKISMHFSIEARVPMLDNDLIDFVESLPLEYKLKGKAGKHIHKKLAESILPKEIIYRKKKGFKSPTEKWFKDQKYYKMLTQKDTKFSEVFDIDAVDNVFKLHFRGKRNMEKQIFMLISIFYVLKY